MESLQKALGHGLAVAGRISWKIFQSAILKVLFLMDEEHLEMAIEQNVDMLPLALIYASKGVETARQIAGRMGGSYEHKITLESSLKWLKEQSTGRRRGYYDVIVNLPPLDPSSDSNSNSGEVPGSRPGPEVYPPPGADPVRVMWFWSNVQRLTRFVFHGEVPESSRKWGVDHLRWLAEQERQGRTRLDQLLEEADRQNQESKKV